MQMVRFTYKVNLTCSLGASEVGSPLLVGRAAMRYLAAFVASFVP